MEIAMSALDRGRYVTAWGIDGALLMASDAALLEAAEATPLPATLLVLSFAVLLDIWALAVAAVVASVAALMGWYWPRGQTQET